MYIRYHTSNTLVLEDCFEGVSAVFSKHCDLGNGQESEPRRPGNRWIVGSFVVARDRSDLSLRSDEGGHFEVSFPAQPEDLRE